MTGADIFAYLANLKVNYEIFIRAFAGKNYKRL